VGSVLIKRVEISPQPSSELSDRVVGVEVNILILDRSPMPFDKHVVHPSAFTIHADLNAVGLQDAGEGIARGIATIYPSFWEIPAPFNPSKN
jgi:hypothetical protein